jgi:hypothetical protein
MPYLGGRFRRWPGPLYAAYDAIFSAFSDDDRAWLFHRIAERWYASVTAADG